MAQLQPIPFGRYRLLFRLASGGMGELFVALTPDDEPCVVKRMLAQHADKPDFVRMFLAEARLLQRLRHPNIVEVLEVGEASSQPFFAMELVRGRSLRHLIDALQRMDKALPARLVAEIGVQLLDGLHHAHCAREEGRELGVVHRDINPHNVLIGWDGRIRLIDFGIAKSDVSGFHTAVGTIKGKFAYMSPEQSAADPIDARSDLFSVAIVLYEALTLENPFARPNVVLALEAIQLHSVPPPSSARSDAAPLDDVLLRALEKNPDLRYPSAAAFSEALRERAARLPEALGSLDTLMSVVFEAEIRAEAQRLAAAGVTRPDEDEPTHPIPRQPAERRPRPRPIPGPGGEEASAAPALPASSGRRAARPPAPAPSGRRWLGYAAVLVVMTAFSFGVTRAVMAPSSRTEVPRATVRVEAEPPVWVRLGGPNWVRTPFEARIHGAEGAIELATDGGLRASATYQVASGGLRLDSAGPDLTIRAVGPGAGSGRLLFRLGSAEDRSQGSIEWTGLGR